ncbi:TPM domain-containing protein [Paeniglutamicibacter cryotolerans]|uniref:Putative nucleic acid-binding Zn-ribbon protein n=1 Tax=Paeniglutamicibacter cryotolerans TaxID=670079 RepID=A0A839QRG9_9MICC|nr:TPM domain-containing protein [Paeniglutamicibacter cryotolerans]MBB2996576.1 putative nucleic acid-binding Zn-ribbon protein [Paeniglutamicibacter cryotolerans]
MRSTLRRLAYAAAAATLSVFLLAPAASAEPPVTIPPGQFVVDQAGVLGSDATEVEKAINDMRAKTSQNLFVIYVDSFTDPTDPDAWVEEVATKKGMGTNDSILAVAVDSRLVRFTPNSAGPIAASQQKILDSLLPQLAKEQWADAALTAVKGIERASGGGSAAPWIIGGVVVVGGGAAAWALTRRKKLGTDAPRPAAGPDGKPIDPLDSMSIPDLRSKAGSLLIAADDAIRSSQQEVGFAQAQYGDEAVKPFTADIEAAKTHMNESFKLQQQLDDDIPDTEEQQRTWLTEIIRRCEAVNETLEQHTAEFESLRELEANAPAAIADLKARAPQLRARLSADQASMDALAAQYSTSALSQVRENIAEAGERLDFVDNAVTTSEAKLAGGITSEAAVALRAGEDALDQATVLLDAIGKTGTDLATARRDMEAAISAGAQDLAQARALISNGSNPELAGPAAALEQALGQVQQQVQSGLIDPVALLSTVNEARRDLDAPLDSIRDAQAQAQRAAEQLQAMIRQAQGKIQGTDDFIRARRGGVGATARTRLAEAQRNLDEALRLGSSDPVSALAYASRAASLADQAARQAENDVNGFGGGMGGGRGNNGLGGAILGGILIDSILRGGSGGHSSGGGIFGGGGFGGFGGGGGGGFGGGGFGGGAGGSF